MKLIYVTMLLPVLASGAGLPPPPPPIPANVPMAPAFKAETLANIDADFTAIQNSARYGAPAGPKAPEPPRIPDNVPLPPKFNAATQAAIDADFARLAFASPTLNSLGLGAVGRAGRAPASEAVETAVVAEESEFSAVFAEIRPPVPSAFAILSAPEARRAPIAISGSEISAQVALFAQAVDEENSLFQRVHRKYEQKFPRLVVAAD